MNNNILLDNDFLIALSEQHEREIYARITVLDINEVPIESIEGKITTGNINIDGNSTIRRTCSLTMISQDININDFYWSVKSKFQLEIGLRNQLIEEYGSDNYPEIVWFPQGIYLISTFNTSLSANSCTISISGKDKMCLLNGDFSGQLFSSIDFGCEDYEFLQMEEISSDEKFFSSEEIIKNNFYIKIETDDENFSISQTEINSFFANKERETDAYASLLGDVLYCAVLDKNGNFYLDDNEKIYKKISNNDENIKCYSIYQKVKNPDVLFKPISNSNVVYEPNKYYYKKIFNNDNSHYYLLDSAKTQRLNNITDYYELVPLYESYKKLYKVKIPIKKIIREAVHAYAHEPYENIIIKDLDEYGLEQLTYKGDSVLYALYNVGSGTYDDNNDVWEINLGTNTYDQLYEKYTLDEAQDSLLNQLRALLFNNEFVFNSLNSFTNNKSSKIYLVTTQNGTQFYASEEDDIFNEEGSFDPNNTNNNKSFRAYTVTKIESGGDIGYRFSDLVYAGDLIGTIGENLTSILDKIKTMLGEFEYFYNLDGKFVFQKKPNYIQTSWNRLIKNEDEENFYIDYTANKFSYNFEGNNLISAIQNSPILNNVRNDYTIWGKRKGISGQEIPIHIRYAIDKKPIRYKNLNNKIYINKDYFLLEENNDILTEENYLLVDWRELIYQMALDYFAAQGATQKNPLYINNLEKPITPDNFLYEVGKRNPQYYPTGYTGYEQYYTDMQGFWRQLYNPEYIPQAIYKEGFYTERIIPIANGISDKIKEWNDPTIESYNIEYYIDNTTYQLPEEFKNQYQKYFLEPTDDKVYWNIDVFEYPEKLNFWIDFLDSENELKQFSVPQIGIRSKVVNESSVSSIIYSNIPDFIFYNDSSDIEEDINNPILEEVKNDNSLPENLKNNFGYTLIQLPNNYFQYFTLSKRKSSLKNKLDELLYKYSYCSENITITAIPIYYLQPNTRIFVYDKNTHIEGEYIINKITLPLTYNGTMSITANKAPQRLY